MPNYLPKGFRDYLFDQADALHTAAETVAAVYARWGYRRLVPASIEDADSYLRGAGDHIRSQSFRFADRNGELLALRSDMTLQAARVIGGALHDTPPPIRLCYADRCFRNAPDGEGALREIWQAGAELAGASGSEADAEVIAVTLEALAALGVGNVQVDLGHAGFIREFLRDLTPEASAEAARALERKDGRALRELAKHGLLSEKSATTGEALIQSFGLASVDAVAALSLPFSEQPLADLRGIVSVLQGYGVTAKLTFDPGEVRGLDYYTGFFFHIYSGGTKAPVAAGGRYDGLLRAYGRDLPAVGGAIDLGTLAGRVIPTRANRVHVVNYRADRTEALTLSKSLRDSGALVSRDLVTRPFEESLAFARQTGLDWLVILEKDGTQRVVSAQDGANVAMKTSDDLFVYLKNLWP